MKEFKKLMIELYKECSTEERRILKKIVYKLNLPETKIDNLWTEIVWLGGVANDFERM